MSSDLNKGTSTVTIPDATTVSISADGRVVIPYAVSYIAGQPSVQSVTLEQPSVQLGPDYTKPPSASSAPAFKDVCDGNMSENITTPDPVVVSRVIEYLRMCDDEHRKNMLGLNELAKRDKQIEEITEHARIILDELDELKSKYSRAQDEYGIMSRKCDELTAQNTTLQQEHATLKRHFDIITNGFAVLNNMVTTHQRGNE